jgi:hypothetical protein
MAAGLLMAVPMSRSFYITGTQDEGDVGLWLDDGSFHFVLQATWLALQEHHEPPWPEYRHACLEQLSIPGVGVLCSRLSLLGQDDVGVLADALEEFLARLPGCMISADVDGNEVDVSALLEALDDAGWLDAYWTVPAFEVERSRGTLPLIISALRGRSGGPIGSEASRAWAEIGSKVLSGKDA